MGDSSWYSTRFLIIVSFHFTYFRLIVIYLKKNCSPFKYHTVIIVCACFRYKKNGTQAHKRPIESSENQLWCYYCFFFSIFRKRKKEAAASGISSKNNHQRQQKIEKEKMKNKMQITSKFQDDFLSDFRFFVFVYCCCFVFSQFRNIQIFTARSGIILFYCNSVWLTVVCVFRVCV